MRRLRSNISAMYAYTLWSVAQGNVTVYIRFSSLSKWRVITIRTDASATYKLSL